MKKSIIFIIAFGFSCIAIAQTHSYSTFYYQRATLFEKLTISNGDIVFLGNSITNGGEWLELFNNQGYVKWVEIVKPYLSK